MQPIGGLTVLVNLFIIFLGNVKKKLSKYISLNLHLSLPRYTPHVIVFSCFALSFAGLFFIVKDSVYSYDSNYYIYDLGPPCEPFAINLSGDRQVILRLDDVQAFAWRDVSFAIVNEATSRKIPLVLGIIPFRLQDDPATTGYIKKNVCNLEIAQHGWSTDKYAHDTNETEKLNETNIYFNIMAGKSELEKISSDPVITFIPPFNVYSSKTAYALKSAKFSIISSDNGGLYDSTTLTYDYQKNESISTSKIVSSCEEAFKKSLPCIIMIHPQDFATNGKLDEKKYYAFTALLDDLQGRNVTFVRFKDIYHP